MITRALVIAVVLAQAAAPGLRRDEALENDVYRAALSRIPETPGRHALFESTVDPSAYWNLSPEVNPKNRLASARPETVDALIAVVRERGRIPNALRSFKDIFPIDDATAREVGPWGWDAFERSHGLALGTIGLSRIGFDQSHSEALLYAVYVCGSLCGHAVVLRLERGPKEWTVAEVYGYGESDADVTVITHSQEETAEIGRQLAPTLSPGSVLLLVGDLGAGKTALVRGLAEGLGISPEDVSSPTFTLMQEYRGGRLKLIHVDLYRLNDGREIDELGLEELGLESVLAIEWAEKLPRPIADSVEVRIDHGDGDTRTITLTGSSGLLS